MKHFQKEFECHTTLVDHFYDKLEGKVGFSSIFRTIIDVKEKPVVVMASRYHGADPKGSDT
jgi:hypothetical protein